MAVTITFEKKHFLMAGIIIAIPFVLIAINSIFAATTMPVVGHSISELFVDRDLNMSPYNIITSGNISIMGPGSIIFSDGSIQNTAINKSTYKVFAKCTGCGNTAGEPICTPSDESAEVCPAGWSEIFFAKHNTDFSTTGTLYTEPMTITDVSLTNEVYTYSSEGASRCTSNANVIDGNGVVLAESNIFQPMSGSYAHCKSWCSYRVCQAI